MFHAISGKYTTGKSILYCVRMYRLWFVASCPLDGTFSSNGSESSKFVSLNRTTKMEEKKKKTTHIEFRSVPQDYN